MNRDKPKILIFDDETDVRELMVITLDENEYEIVAFCSAVGVIDKVLSEGPDVILMDITMPEINGLEALSMLKQDDRTASIPVIMASAQARREILEDAATRGASDFIVKPWEDGELEWRIGECLKESSENAA